MMDNKIFMIFQPILNTFSKPVGLAGTVVAWASNGLSNAKIRSPTTSNDSLSSKLKWCNSKIRVEFKFSCLKQDKVTFAPNIVVNLFIIYELKRWSQH